MRRHDVRHVLGFEPCGSRRLDTPTLVGIISMMSCSMCANPSADGLDDSKTLLVWPRQGSMAGSWLETGRLVAMMPPCQHDWVAMQQWPA